MAAGSYSYTYDANGNRTGKVVDGTTAVAARTTSHAWDAWDRLRETAIPVSATAKRYYRNTYDYRMRRLAKSQNGSGLTTQHTAITYSGGQSVAEYNRTGNTALAASASAAKQYVRGPDMGGGVGGLLYTLSGSTQTVKFNLSNGRGDIVAQTSSAGLITWKASYEAYGKQTKETGANTDTQRANSKEEDEATGLLNEGHRYRDLETGVWLSRDPAGFVDGPNLYAYVKQNPWSKFDPLGLDDENAGETIAKAQQENTDFVRSLGHDDIADARQRLLDNGKSMASSTAEAMDAVVSMTPIGTANEVIFGENSMGEPLTWDQRGMSAVSAIPAGKYLDKLHDILGAAAKATAGKTDEVVEAMVKNADAGAAKSTPQFAEGSFSITQRGWEGYPTGVPKPAGPYRLLEGAEYDAARKAANQANNQIRIDQGLRGQLVDVHEIQPVKFGGAATDPANKLILDRAIHRQQVTPWWNQLLRDITGG